MGVLDGVEGRRSWVSSLRPCSVAATHPPAAALLAARPHVGVVWQVGALSLQYLRICSLGVAVGGWCVC